MKYCESCGNTGFKLARALIRTEAASLLPKETK
jgi:hypothetical protein